MLIYILSFIGTHVECPVCRKVTDIPSEGLPSNYVVQDAAEAVRKRHDLSKKATKSVKEFHEKVSSLCGQLNQKLDKWNLISEVLNGVAAKSLEMTETTKSMGIEYCQKSLNDIEKMTEIIEDIATNFDHLRETHILATLRQNRVNILIKDINIQIPTDVIDLSTLSLEENQIGASADAKATRQVQ